MLASEPTSFVRSRVACALLSFPLLHCGVSGESFETPGSGGTAPDAGPATAGFTGSVAVPNAGHGSGGAGTSGGPSQQGGGGMGNEGGKSTPGGQAGSSGGMRGTVEPSLPCTGKPGAVRGKSDQMLTAAGLSRTFVHYAPANLDPNTPAPVVIVAHGWTMSGQQMYDITQYHQIADREGFVVMYPDGEPASIGPWNVGNGACPSAFAVLPVATGDDQAFIDAMLEFAEADQCLAREHVFVTGFSMGGYFANETGCLRPDIAGIGPHSGGSHDLSACPVQHKPAILFHGDLDAVIPITCGNEARDRWVQQNGCGSEVETVEVKGGHCEYSKDCPADGQVALCLFDGMGHGWAGGQGGASAYPDYEAASQLGWEFFKEYAW